MNSTSPSGRNRSLAGDPRFATRVLAVVRRIPPGRVATYGDVAEAAGHPRAWRAVGNIMRTCSAPDVPCHRVIAAAGKLGGYGGNIAMKRALLQAEGVQVSGTRIRDFQRRRWMARKPRAAELRRRKMTSEERDGNQKRDPRDLCDSR